MPSPLVVKVSMKSKCGKGKNVQLSTLEEEEDFRVSAMSIFEKMQVLDPFVVLAAASQLPPAQSSTPQTSMPSHLMRSSYTTPLSNTSPSTTAGYTVAEPPRQKSQDPSSSMQMMYVQSASPQQPTLTQSPLPFVNPSAKQNIPLYTGSPIQPLSHLYSFQSTTLPSPHSDLGDIVHLLPLNGSSSYPQQQQTHPQITGAGMYVSSLAPQRTLTGPNYAYLNNNTNAPQNMYSSLQPQTALVQNTENGSQRGGESPVLYWDVVNKIYVLHTPTPLQPLPPENSTQPPPQPSHQPASFYIPVPSTPDGLGSRGTPIGSSTISSHSGLTMYTLQPTSSTPSHNWHGATLTEPSASSLSNTNNNAFCLLPSAGSCLVPYHTTSSSVSSQAGGPVLTASLVSPPFRPSHASSRSSAGPLHPSPISLAPLGNSSSSSNPMRDLALLTTHGSSSSTVFHSGGTIQALHQSPTPGNSIPGTGLQGTSLDDHFSSVSSFRFQQVVLQVLPHLYDRVLNTLFIRLHKRQKIASAGRWTSFATSTLRLRCFRYTPEDYQKYPSLACHITATDKRCAKETTSPATVLLADAHVGQLLWEKYLRWEYLLPACLKIIGESIGDRSTTYGVPPFVSGSAFRSRVDVAVDPETVLQQVVLVPKVRTDKKPVLFASTSTLPTSSAYILEDLPRVKEATEDGDADEAINLAQAKLKLYQLVKEISSVLVMQNPLLTAVSQVQLRTVIQCILAHVFTHDVSEGPPPRVPEEGELAITHEMTHSAEGKEGTPSCRPPLMQTPHGNYRELNSYRYTCDTLVDALLHDTVSERMVLRVEHLHRVWRWWQWSEDRLSRSSSVQ